MPSIEERQKLLHVLLRCRTLVQKWGASCWSSMDADEITAALDEAITSLRGAGEMRSGELRLLFAPTGALQEAALDYGWSEEYLELATEFDEAVEPWA